MNNKLTSFTEGKIYKFNPDSFGENRKYHKWIECIINDLVKVQLEGLGFIKCNIKGIIKDYPVYPWMCYEVI